MIKGRGDCNLHRDAAGVAARRPWRG